MSAASIELNETSQHVLRDLVQKTGQSEQTVVAQALEVYRRKVFLDAVNEGYAALRADPQAWSEELAERRAWDATLADGLPPEEWTEDGQCLTPQSQEP